MNYIAEINAFYDWLEINPLSTSAIVLWHSLMHINNKCRWANEFTVAASVLSVKSGLTDRTIRNARNELKQKGRIDWKTRGGNKAASYSLVSLSETISDTLTDTITDNATDTTTDNLSTLSKHKLNKTIENNNNSKIKILNFDELNEVLLNSDLWIENVQRANVRSLNGKNTYLTAEEVKNYIKQFLVQLAAAEDCNRSEADAKKYFSNWLRIELRKEEQQDGKDRQFKSSKGGYTKPRTVEAGIKTISF